jgi:transposase
VASCAGLRERPTRSLEHRATVRALRATAQRIQFLQVEAEQLQAELTVLVRAAVPWLLEVPGVGPLSAAQVLVSWSHAGRFRSEAAFAALAGTNPIPASSGQVTRYRLNRGGDRQLNRALHTILLVRLRTDPDPRAYMARRTAEGKSRRDAKRCLRRIIARQLFRLWDSRPESSPGLAMDRVQLAAPGQSHGVCAGESTYKRRWEMYAPALHRIASHD